MLVKKVCFKIFGKKRVFIQEKLKEKAKYIWHLNLYLRQGIRSRAGVPVCMIPVKCPTSIAFATCG